MSSLPKKTKVVSKKPETDKQVVGSSAAFHMVMSAKVAVNPLNKKG